VGSGNGRAALNGGGLFEESLILLCVERETWPICVACCRILEVFRFSVVNYEWLQNKSKI
jgi:hypothetical protein